MGFVRQDVLQGSVYWGSFTGDIWIWAGEGGTNIVRRARTMLARVS
jgi:hypothetical protein